VFFFVILFTAIQLAGLAARDSLRLDAGLCLYGNDIDEGTSPVAARYTWCIDKTKTNYVGANVIVPTLPNKTAVYRVGLSTSGRAARHGGCLF
jgi:aminomethyltransferase